jgi:hypothetical protein
VFDIDNGDDSEDLVILGEKGGKSNKGKANEVIHQVVVCIKLFVIPSRRLILSFLTCK